MGQITEQIGLPKLEWQPIKEKMNSEFQTVENATGNHSAIFSRNSWQTTEIKGISGEL